MYGSNRFVSVNQMRLDSHSETPGSSTAFEKTQPGRIATFLNSFIGQYGAAGRPTKKTSVAVLALALPSRRGSDKVLDPLSRLLHKCDDNRTSRASGRKGRTEDTARESTSWHQVAQGGHTTRGVLAVFLCWVEKRCSVGMEQGPGGALQNSPGCYQPRKPHPHY